MHSGLCSAACSAGAAALGPWLAQPEPGAERLISAALVLDLLYPPTGAPPWTSGASGRSGAATRAARSTPLSRRCLQEPTPIAESELPLTLPDTDDFKPSGTPDPPLAKCADWVQTTDPQGRPARRETSTMPQWAGSCWYYLRFIDPLNSNR